MEFGSEDELLQEEEEEEDRRRRKQEKSKASTKMDPSLQPRTTSSRSRTR